jgi:hypothetical protein
LTAEIVCPPNAAGPGAATWVLYQPSGRFWHFQSIESGVFLALAGALIYVALRRLRRIA